MSDKVSDERLREYAASFNNPDVRALAAELLALRAQQQAAGWSELASIRNELAEMATWIDNDGTASQIVTGDELRALTAPINSAIEPAPVAAHVSRLTEALEKISRMHTVPDDKTNTFTLAMAHVVAAKALNHTDGDA